MSARAHFVLAICGAWSAAVAAPLAETQPLALEGDLSIAMVAGIDRWLERQTVGIAAVRSARWALAHTTEEKRERLRTILGAVDARLPARFEILIAPDAARAQPAPGACTVERVRWPVFADVAGEGLLLRPPGTPRAVVIAIPDADQTPEMLAGLQPGAPLAARLAERGCLVVIPTLVDRRCDWSGSERLNRFTNQPHREWIYRQAFEMGRTLIGYEVQMVQAALDAALALAPGVKAGVFGYGEGGLVALHSTALDPRLAAAVVSGYFGPRERLWEEPIYRNLFGLLRDFGDAEIASLAAPRPVLIEHSAAPEIDGPPPPRERRAAAAPGRITTTPATAAEAEVKRANILARAPQVDFHHTPGAAAPGRETTLTTFLAALGIEHAPAVHAAPRADFDLSPAATDARQQRLVRGWEEYTQRLLRLSDTRRATKLWASLKPSADITAAQAEVRSALWEDVIGKLPTDYLPANARTRPLPSNAKWTGYEVMLDVLPDVFAWGWLLLPKDLRPGERRPVVICQHGLEGLPEDVATENHEHPGWRFYKGFATDLAARGFIVYAPHNPYRGKDAFRMLQRKANPLGLSLFSFIIAQHDVTTRWLASLPFVDSTRIGFYGLSYGGKTAMRVPAILYRYCLSICSGDFNEWIGKNVSTAWTSNYPFTGEWEMPEWNMGGIAGYAEMAMLIAPRPFMVERGHDDGVGLDQWVGYEWGKVRQGYDKLGLPERAEIEWFNGPHTINGVGTFTFLHRHLAWPENSKVQSPSPK